MSLVSVIADDLTGAADCGIAFTLAGLDTYVAVGAGRLPPVDVVAVDTDSRQLLPSAAAARVHAAAREAYAGGARTLYKKIDSTLRGNVGPEIAAAVRAAREVLGRPPLVVASPAFPATGRTTRGGRVLVAGVPLEETEVWRRSGATGPADLPSILAAAGLRPAVVGAGAVRAGKDGLRRTLERAGEAGNEALICDAEEESDLAAIAGAGAALAGPVLWVGSAGLARALPDALGLRRDAPAGAAGPPQGGGGPVLVLVGSRSSIAREQARRLAEEPGVASLEVAPEVLLAGEDAAAWASAREQLGGAISAGRDAVLLIGAGERVDLAQGPALAGALGRLAAAEAGSLGGLVATGGDVARAALAALGAGGVHLRGEVEPGVPVGVADGRHRLTVVTKAGAFGGPDTLRRCRAALARGREETP